LFLDNKNIWPAQRTVKHAMPNSMQLGKLASLAEAGQPAA